MEPAKFEVRSLTFGDDCRACSAEYVDRRCVCDGTRRASRTKSSGFRLHSQFVRGRRAYLGLCPSSRRPQRYRHRSVGDGERVACYGGDDGLREVEAGLRRFAGLGLGMFLCLGCSTTSTIARIHEAPIEGDIVGSSAESIFVARDSGASARSSATTSARLTTLATCTEMWASRLACMAR